MVGCHTCTLSWDENEVINDDSSIKIKNKFYNTKPLSSGLHNSEWQPKSMMTLWTFQSIFGECFLLFLVLLLLTFFWHFCMSARTREWENITTRRQYEQIINFLISITYWHRCRWWWASLMKGLCHGHDDWTPFDMIPMNFWCYAKALVHSYGWSTPMDGS